MSEPRTIVVIGGGPNGLAAALHLARKGKRVTVCEARDAVGGLAAGREFHPGYRHAGIHHDTLVRPEAASALGLKLDFASRSPTLGLSEAGEVVSVPGSDPGYAAYQSVLDEAGDFARGVLSAVPPEIGTDAPIWPLAKSALDFRRLGRDRMLQLLWLGPQSLDDFTREFADHPQFRAIWSLAPLIGSWAGPISPETAPNLLIYDLLGTHAVSGGPAAVVAALQAACTSAGVELQTGARVERIRIDSSGVRGVELAGGGSIDAPWVLSTLGPRTTLLDLVPPPWLDGNVERDVEDVRVRGIDSKVHLALSSPLQLGGKTVERAAVVRDSLEIERAFDGVKYGELSDGPLPLDVRQFDAGGKPVASIFVHGTPYDLKGGWTDAVRAQLLDRVLGSMERYWPDIRDRVVGHELLTPVDLEREYGAEGGHLFHGELALDQLFVLRPTVHLARYAVPGTRGLFVGGGGCHPCGGVTLLPGRLAAEAMLSAG